MEFSDKIDFSDNVKSYYDSLGSKQNSRTTSYFFSNLQIHGYEISYVTFLSRKMLDR